MAINIDTITNVFLGVLMATTAYTLGVAGLKYAYDAAHKMMRRERRSDPDPERGI